MQGVITLPVIHAYKHGENSEELKNIIENRQMSLEELNRAINIVKIPTVLILQDKLLQNF